MSAESRTDRAADQTVECRPTLWGEILTGSKEALQRLGIAVDLPFPGEAGAPKRCLKVRDPRGYDVRILTDDSGDGFRVAIDFPGRKPPKIAMRRDFAPGVTLEEYWPSDIFTGTADDLIAAGLVKAGQFPGQPGMRKAIVSILADGTFPKGAPTAAHRRTAEPGAKRIQRKSKTTFQVMVSVSKDVAAARLDAYRAAEKDYEARMDALPRPASLIARDSLGGNVVDLHVARAARQQVRTARQIEHRIPTNDSTRRVATREGGQARLLWVSQTEAEFLSHILEYGPEGAAKRLMQLAGKPWPETQPPPGKVSASTNIRPLIGGDK